MQVEDLDLHFLFIKCKGRLSDWQLTDSQAYLCEFTWYAAVSVLLISHYD